MFQSPSSSYHSSFVSLDDESSSAFRVDDIFDEIESSILPSRKQRLSNAAIEQLTVNKLRFDSVGLYGRDHERAALMQRLSNVTPNNISTNDNCGDFYNNYSSQGVRTTKRRLELILLSGYSGTGKSKLALSIGKMVSKVNGVFGYGKFDLNSVSQDEPYAGIITACNQICEHMVRVHTRNSNELHGTSTASSAAAASEIVEKLDEMELYLLSGIIPDLKHLIAFLKYRADSSTSSSSFENKMTEIFSSANLLDTKAILLYAFRKFIRIVAYHFPPLVMVLDDMQWTDSASLDLLQELLTDHEIDNLMIVVCYRSNEVNDAHLLSKLMRNLKQQQQSTNSNNNQNRDGGLSITDLHIGNLDVTAANQVLMALLNVDDKPTETLQLAEICHKRTQGNIFFFLTFMEMLQQHKLLEFNLGRLSWTWNVEEIEKKTAATANVVDVLSCKIKKSSSGSEMTRLLLIAACLGSTFEKKILYKLFVKVHYGAQTTSAIDGAVRGSAFEIVHKKASNETRESNGSWRIELFDQLLDEAVHENFLENVMMNNNDTSTTEQNFRFVHDKVQEAAMALLSQDQLNQLQHQVGMALRNELNEKELEELIFVVVNLLNSRNHNCTKDLGCEGSGKKAEESEEYSLSDSIDIAKLNLRAAEKAKSLSAFASSARYAAFGLRILPKDDSSLNAHHSLYMDLYSTGAEMENCLGNTDQMKIYCNNALNLKKRSSTVLDKLRVYKVLMDFMGNTGQPIDAYHLCLKVLRELGYKQFPRGSVAQSIALIKSLYHLKTTSKNKHVCSNEYISSMPLMSDQVMIECAKLLDKASTYAYVAEFPKVLPIFISHLITLTFRFGICDSSANAFAHGGILVAQIFGDNEAGSLYGELALTTMRRLKDSPSYSPSSTMYTVYGYVKSWQTPLTGIENRLMEAYKIGLQCGDTESASYSIGTNFCVQLVVGKQLKAIEEDSRVYLPQMRALKREEAARAIMLCHQASLNLMGRSFHCARLDGEALDKDEFLNYAKSTQSGVTMAMYKFVLQFLYAYLGEHELGARLAIKRGDGLAKLFPGWLISMHDPFLRGISFYAMARKKTTSSKNRGRYILHGNRARSNIRSMVKKGNPNVVHHLKLLDAEQNALVGKFEKASKLFYDATVLASRGGFIHDAALCNERFAIYLLECNKNNDRQNAIGRIEDAYKYYSEWGAHAKLDSLRSQLVASAPPNGRYC